MASDSKLQSKIPKGLKVRALLCAMGVNSLMGMFYAYTNMYIYISHYLRIYDKSLDADGKDVLLVMPVWIICLSIASIASIKIADRIGFWALNYIACFWFCINHLAVIFIKSYYLFVLVYGVGNGLACGLGYLPSLYIAWTYFPDKKPMATGIILFSTGISFFFLSPIITHLVNPDNLKDDHDDVRKRVPFMFACLTGSFSLITLLSCSLQPSPWHQYENDGRSGGDQPSDHKTQKLKDLVERAKVLGIELDSQALGIHKLGEELAVHGGQGLFIVGQLKSQSINNITLNMEHNPNASVEEGLDKEAKLISTADLDKEIKRIACLIREKSCPNLRAGLTSTHFFFIVFMVFCSSIYYYLILTSWKHYFKSMISLRDRQLSYMLSIGSIGNALGKVLSGILLLKLSFKTLYIGANCLIIIYACSFNYVMANAGNIFTASTYLCLAFFGLGMNMTMFPTVCMKAFGGAVGSRIYPVVYFCFAMSNLFAYLFYKHLDNTQALFTVMAVMSAAGIVACALFNQNPVWHRSAEGKPTVEVELND